MVKTEDIPAVEQREKVESTQKENLDFEGTYRIVLEDGTIKHLHSIAHPRLNEVGDVIEVVGTTMDVTERKLADEERERLRQVQADLAHLSRVTTMRELTASLPHQISHPLAAPLTNA